MKDTEAALRALHEEVPWAQETARIHGRRHALPRLTCWMADPGCTYSYSGLRQPITPWTPAVAVLRQRLEAHLDCRFNSVLLNLYRDGHDAMGWHADNESELDPEAPIASLSLGAVRDFKLRPRGGASGGEPIMLALGDGDLLVMDPPTQQHWQHQLPRRLRQRLPRINLTFRRVGPLSVVSTR